MLAPTTLIGLACLIASSSPPDQAKLIENLSKEEIAVIGQVIQSGSCLPENFELRLKGDEMRINGIGSMPTRECF